MALQLIHEAALCSTGLRQRRSLSQRGFELANGLPFVASDVAIHNLLAEHTVAESRRLQVALGKIRRASGDYLGKLLAIDPHRTRSYSKRQMRRYRDDDKSRPFKVAPTFFALDPDTHQPVCFTIGTSARTATIATIDLLELATEILTPQPGETLVLADLEHLTIDLFQHAQLHTPFDLLVPMKNERSVQKQLRAIPFSPSSAEYTVGQANRGTHRSNCNEVLGAAICSCHFMQCQRLFAVIAGARERSIHGSVVSCSWSSS
ncbi:MAG: hypothetical protein ACYTG0_34560, partial [Planctomycetota bacterium]